MSHVDEIQARYAPLLKEIATYYADDQLLCEQLAATTVVREDWDDNRAGGHFYMEVAASAAAMPDCYIDARTCDDDWAFVDVILHTVNGNLNWGEWFRYDHQPVSRWPLPTRTP